MITKVKTVAKKRGKYRTHNRGDMIKWRSESLKNVINNPSSNIEDIIVAQSILEKRKNNTTFTDNMIEMFFSTKNKFWNLAMWQLYREGKAKTYHNGQKKVWYIDDNEMIFDKMVELRCAYEMYMSQKNDKETIKTGISAWKR